jgi:TatD DNase family protein
MWIDVHAHLAELPADRLNAMLAAASAASVTTIVNTGVDLASSRTVIDQCSAHSQCLAAVGVSPFDVDALPQGWEDTLAELATSPGVVAVGETGIDASNPRYPPIETQVPYLETQAALAVRLGLPLVVHSRGAERRAVDVCRSSGVTRAMFHCFTGERDALRAIIDNGYYVSFSGIVTFAKSPLGEQVRYAPLDRLFVETDTPYLAPVPHRGAPNQPAWVGLVGEAVAALRGERPDELAAALRHNFQTLFGRAPLPPVLE